MSFPLLELPVEMVTAILNFADKKSLLKLSQASKTTHQLAWPIFLNRKTADRIKFTETCDRCNIIVQFSFGKDNLRSKFDFLEALKCIQAPVFYDNSEGMYTTMDEYESIEFFDRLSSKTQGINVDLLEFEPTRTIISLISKIFEGKSVPELAFKLDDRILDFNSLLDLVSQLKSTSIHVHLRKVYPGNYLGKLATVVDSISISGSVNREDSVGWRAHDILRRRCSHLDLTNCSLKFQSVDVLLLSSMLNVDIGQKPFYLAARPADNYTSQSDYEKSCLAVNNHVSQMIKNHNSSDKNTIELRHVNIT